MEKIPRINNLEPQENSDSKEKGGNYTRLAILKEIKEFSTPLVEKLKSRIETGAYDVLVSDEGRGRIPTLLLRKIFQKVNQEKSLETFFVASGRMKMDSKAIADFVRINNLKDKTILIVTEYVSGGGSIRRMTDEFKKNGVKNLDVAALAINERFNQTSDGRRDFEELEHALARAGTRLFYGQAGELIGADLNRISGVKKKIDENGKIVGAHPQLWKPLSDKDMFYSAREDVPVMADEIVEQVWALNKAKDR